MSVVTTTGDSNQVVPLIRERQVRIKRCSKTLLAGQAHQGCIM